MYDKSVFIFRRDLRLDDNIGLCAALSQSIVVIPCFIFDPRQVEEQNAYRSVHAIQFMIEALYELDQALKEKKSNLFVFLGEPDRVVQTVIEKERIDAIFINRDYTPFSLARDKAIQDVAKDHNVAFHQYDDVLLTNPEHVYTKKGAPYSIFSAFYKIASRIPVSQPIACKEKGYFTGSIQYVQQLNELSKRILPQFNQKLAVHGGIREANAKLHNLSKFTQYAKTRDVPNIVTSLLSAYLKFGCVSVRTVYHTVHTTFGKSHPLIRQLYWRDFFTHIAFHYPHVFGHAFRIKYDQLQWSDNEKFFVAWCTGTTGFPIVDAGMRQLNETGFMHNRVRMIVASFLVKDLHIDWRKGERYFAQKLVDYDPAVNNGNWQWCASTGCDAQPYFRIFNPWLQQKKYDFDCAYIKQWISEFKQVDPKIIHTWYKNSSTLIKDYPRPIVDHAMQAAYSKQHFKRLSK